MRRRNTLSNDPTVQILGGIFVATCIVNGVLVWLGLPAKSMITFGIAVVVVVIVGLALKMGIPLKSGMPSTPTASKLAQQFDQARYMSGTQFEHYMASLFRSLGYRATVLGGSGDQGVDIRLKKGSENIAVQCKNYAKPVGNPPVQQVHAGKDYHRASEGWVVAPSGYTRGAVDLASRLGVRLYDERSIRSWIRKVEALEAEQASQQVR